MQIKYLSGKRLKFRINWASLGKQFVQAEQEHTVTRLEIQVFYSLFSVWLRQSTGTWFLHVKTGNKTISSIQKYSDNLHSKTLPHSFGSSWTDYLQAPLLIIQVQVLFLHHNTQLSFHFTALLSLGPVCHLGPPSHSLCKTSTSSATLSLSFSSYCPSRYTAASVCCYFNTNPSKKAFVTRLTKLNSPKCNLRRQIHYIGLSPFFCHHTHRKERKRGNPRNFSSTFSLFGLLHRDFAPRWDISTTMWDTNELTLWDKY